MSKRRSTNDHAPDGRDLGTRSVGEQHDDDGGDPQVVSVAKMPEEPSVDRMVMLLECSSTGDKHDVLCAIRKKLPLDSEDDDSLAAKTSKPKDAAFKYDSSDDLPIGQVLTKQGKMKATASHRAWSAPSSIDSKSKKSKSVVDIKVLNNVFKPSSVPRYLWTLPKVNPATKSYTCCKLLTTDAFIDKSAALYYLLKDNFDYSSMDFDSVPLHVVYPRRFAKTTLLQFIEAVFSPVPKLERYTREQVKTKIASLEYGKELLDFGMHPVLYLDMQGISSLNALNKEIAQRLKRAGLEEAAVEQIKISSFSPADLVQKGVQMLNTKFRVDFGVETLTIVLIDEHDKMFRNKEIVEIAESNEDTPPVKEMKRAIAALMDIFAFGKRNETGISLLVLCGLTRMVGVGLSSMNNLEDVSRQSKFHGICGISAREFVKCCSGELNRYARERAPGKTLKVLLEDIFIPKWDGFRFGVDDTVGFLDPDAADGALFSPMDVWEIVQALTDNKKDPSSKWMKTMGSEFEFTNFANWYTATDDGFLELAQNFEGGWVDETSLSENMERRDYMLLSSELHVKKVLFELGLLSVKKIGDRGEVLLGSPNWTVTKNAMRVLVHKTHHLSTPQGLANDYLSDNEEGFGRIVSRAATAVTNVFRATRQQVVREYPFQDYLFMQLFYRFPNCYNCRDYELYKESPVNKPETGENGRLDMAITLHYPRSRKKAFIIEVKIAKEEVRNAARIEKAHQANIKKATTQVLSYQWKGPTVNEVQRVVVSGVWHPSMEGSENCELSATYLFVRP